MQEFLAWVEASSLGHAMRNAGVWAYGVTNLIHILGVATLFGSVLVLDLRLLGLWRRAPLVGLTTATVPLAVTGFAIAVASGSCLISTNATEYIGNPFIPIKFTAIGLGLLNAVIMTFLPAWRERTKRDLTAREQRQLRVAGGVSLASWLTAVSAGRLIGYW